MRGIMNNKKGQDAGLNFFMKLALGLLALILIAFAFYQYFGAVTAPIEKTDIDVALIEQRCSNAISEADFCLGRIELKNNQYANCQFVVKTFGIELENSQYDGNCDQTTAQPAMCARLALEDDTLDWDKVRVNGAECAVQVAEAAADKAAAEAEAAKNCKAEDTANQAECDGKDKTSCPLTTTSDSTQCVWN